MVGLLNDDFECCCKGPCSDLFPGIMKDEEKRKCCKGSTWSTLDISGLGDIQINQTRIFLFQFVFVGGGGGGVPGLNMKVIRVQNVQIF